MSTPPVSPRASSPSITQRPTSPSVSSSQRPSSPSVLHSIIKAAGNALSPKRAESPRPPEGHFGLPQGYSTKYDNEKKPSPPTKHWHVSSLISAARSPSPSLTASPKGSKSPYPDKDPHSPPPSFHMLGSLGSTTSPTPKLHPAVSSSNAPSSPQLRSGHHSPSLGYQMYEALGGGTVSPTPKLHPAVSSANAPSSPQSRSGHHSPSSGYQMFEGLGGGTISPTPQQNSAVGSGNTPSSPQLRGVNNPSTSPSTTAKITSPAVMPSMSLPRPLALRTSPTGQLVASSGELRPSSPQSHKLLTPINEKSEPPSLKTTPTASSSQSLSPIPDTSSSSRSLSPSPANLFYYSETGDRIFPSEPTSPRLAASDSSSRKLSSESEGVDPEVQEIVAKGYPPESLLRAVSPKQTEGSEREKSPLTSAGSPVDELDVEVEIGYEEADADTPKGGGGLPKVVTPEQKPIEAKGSEGDSEEEMSLRDFLKTDPSESLPQPAASEKEQPISGEKQVGETDADVHQSDDEDENEGQPIDSRKQIPSSPGFLQGPAFQSEDHPGGRRPVLVHTELRPPVAASASASSSEMGKASDYRGWWLHSAVRSGATSLCDSIRNCRKTTRQASSASVSSAAVSSQAEKTSAKEGRKPICSKSDWVMAATALSVISFAGYIFQR